MKITRSIRDGARKFTAGCEQELDAYLTPEQGARLLQSGVITGDDWSFLRESEAPASDAPASEAAPTPATAPKKATARRKRK
jgi:uncharacterized metal-binding protein